VLVAVVLVLEGKEVVEKVVAKMVANKTLHLLRVQVKTRFYPQKINSQMRKKNFLWVIATVRVMGLAVKEMEEVLVCVLAYLQFKLPPWVQVHTSQEDTTWLQMLALENTYGKVPHFHRHLFVERKSSPMFLFVEKIVKIKTVAQDSVWVAAVTLKRTTQAKKYKVVSRQNLSLIGLSSWQFLKK
jgi:hypothetical protein